MLQKKLRAGITTGTCAAAAAQAAVLACLGQQTEDVNVVLPDGRSLQVMVASATVTQDCGTASVIKDAGDDPDITNGATITATVELTWGQDVIIQAGSGVGIVTKPGLAVPVGQPAVNPTPRRMIEQAVKTVLPAGRGAVITISIPDGEKLASRTLNPVLGIEGGLSIIGTTGIVEPMSEEAFKNSLTPQINVVKALGYDAIIFVPGKIGQDIATCRYGLPAECVVQTSNFIGHMLESAASLGMRRVLLFGHLGKIVKVAAGVFHTHNRMADARLETIAAYAAGEGAPTEAVREILSCNTTEAAMEVITRFGIQRVYRVLTERASVRATRYCFGEVAVGTVIVTLAGEVLGMDDMAKEIGGSMGWNIK